ncbi:hypothetical protein SAMN05428989_1949 [Pseudoxanthomonas sp. GM95]|nr:hypothetical protein SAMN05428989_1949 [Pseudoxanthomonas sp. GM95]
MIAASSGAHAAQATSYASNMEDVGILGVA